jgi:glycosyltransferase involved in cell wall biosynthesis
VDISIIIPIHNSEKHLSKCVNSCIDQDLLFDRFEIIAVNDGSTDSSLGIINELASKNKCITVIDKPNGGAGSARNAGLDVAKGKYIWFVDSDDWIEPNCVQPLVSVMERYELDALQIGYYSTTIKNRITCNDKYLRTTSVLPPAEYVCPDLFLGGAPLTLFRREIVEQHRIRFYEDICLGEDQLFFLSIFYYARRVKRENILVYNYFLNDNSLTHNATENQLYGSISKIANFTFRSSFEEYCQFQMINGFIYLMYIAQDSSRLFYEMQNHGFITIFNLNHLPPKHQSLLKNYLRFGKPFLRYHSFIQQIKSPIKTVVKKFQ